MFMINSFYQIGALFLPKGVNRSEINETNWANFIHCKIYISLYSCKKKRKSNYTNYLFEQQFAIIDLELPLLYDASFNVLIHLDILI